MTRRIRIFSHNNGNAVNVLKAALTEELGRPVLRIRPEGSRFNPRPDDLVINYGSSNCHISPTQTVLLNKPEAIARATNKRDFFSYLETYNATANAFNNVPLCESTTNRTDAQQWQQNGDTVYARQTLQGHSGAGIIVCGSDDSIPNAPLYTRGITGSRREYRIHVFKGQVILVQKKQRRNGYEENPNYSETVRNLDGGWVFGISSANPSPEVRRAAVNCVEALGLDFGAVDVIAKGRQGQESEVYVLEANTAPGQGGETTTNAYVQAIMAVFSGEEPYAPYAADEEVTQSRGTSQEVREAANNVVGVQAEQPNNTLTAEVSNSVSNQRSGSVGNETPRNSRNSTSARQSGDRSSGSNLLRALSNLFVVDVINGDSDVVASLMNGSYYLFGEEVPVEVRNARQITATA